MALETASEQDTDSLETIVAPCLTLVPAPRPRQINLKTLEQVRREMSVVYREARRGLIPTQDLSRYAFTLSAIGKVIEAADIERRITALENAMDGDESEQD